LTEELKKSNTATISEKLFGQGQNLLVNHAGISERYPMAAISAVLLHNFGAFCVNFLL
jgi:hypothetical protein